MLHKQWRIIGYIVLVMMVMVMSWEQVYSQPLLWNAEQLPEDSIRLRVLPNSDRPADQWLKLRVRDVVTQAMQEWTASLENRQQAEALISERLPDIERLVNETLMQEGFHYPVKVTFGNTEFPNVQYGAHIFPAGEYQAVLIEIGAAQGKNWWCVLYPPLCLVDIVSATVVENPSVMIAAEEQQQTVAEQQQETAAEQQPAIVAAEEPVSSEKAVAEQVMDAAKAEVLLPDEAVEQSENGKANKKTTEVRFFLGELFKK